MSMQKTTLLARNHPSRLSFAELRDRLKGRTQQPEYCDDVDLTEALLFLTALPDEKHTADSVEALIELAKNFKYATQPAHTLDAASRAARIARTRNQKLLLCVARGIEGLALRDLGRFADAAVAQSESWSIARDMGERRREVMAIGNFGTLCSTMGHLDAAIRYERRVRELAEQYGFADLELSARFNLSVYAGQLRDPVSGLRLLTDARMDAPQTRAEMSLIADIQSNLGQLYLLVDDVNSACTHARESERWAKRSRVEKTIRNTDMLFGLIDVHSGDVEKGLSALEDLLLLAKQFAPEELQFRLEACIDAHEVAGQFDKALVHLHEFVAWKKQGLEAGVLALNCEGLNETNQRQADTALFESFLSRAHMLEAGAQSQVQRLIETAINAEMAAGHDLYRTFRVSNLVKYLAVALGYDEERISPLVLGAQLCNIGTIAIPNRVLLKPSGLSTGEVNIVRDHARYGAELLRKSKLNILDMASVLAEQHHERYDGTGYPNRLVGNAIIEEARMVSICDSFDAMTHRRPWRITPLSIEAALSELQHGAGSQFDPQFAGAFIDLIRHQVRAHGDLDKFLTEGADELEYVRARTRMEAALTPTH